MGPTTKVATQDGKFCRSKVKDKNFMFSCFIRPPVSSAHILTTDKHTEV